MNNRNSRVVIGMDPHKRSVTIEVMAADETVLGGGRYATADGFEAPQVLGRSYTGCGSRLKAA